MVGSFEKVVGYLTDAVSLNFDTASPFVLNAFPEEVASLYARAFAFLFGVILLLFLFPLRVVVGLEGVSPFFAPHPSFVFCLGATTGAGVGFGVAGGVGVDIGDIDGLGFGDGVIFGVEYVDLVPPHELLLLPPKLPPLRPPHS